MTLVSHEKLSDCYNLTCNEGKVSNWGEREKGRGIGASKLSSLFPFALSPLLSFTDQVFMDPTFFGIFDCGPLQSFVVNVFTLPRHSLRGRHLKGEREREF